MENVLVVGKQLNEIALASYGFRVHAQWTKIPLDNPSIPKDVDKVVLVSDSVDVALTKLVREACERDLIPLVFTRSDLKDFGSSLKKAVETVAKCEAVLIAEEDNEVLTQESDMAKRDGRSNGANVQRAQEKISYLRELLTRDAKMPTETINVMIAKKFKKALTPTTIAQVRWDEFGVKFGPRGKLIVRDQPTQVAHSMAVASAPKRVGPQTDRLTALLADLRQEMNRAHVTSLEIPAAGEIKAVYGGSATISFN